MFGLLWRLLLFLLLVKMEMCLSVITIQLPCPGTSVYFASSRYTSPDLCGLAPCWFCEDVKLEKLWDLSSGDIILNFQFRVSLPSSCVPALIAVLGEILPITSWAVAATRTAVQSSLNARLCFSQSL